MLTFLGPSQAVALAPHCSSDDIAALAGTHQQVRDVISSDLVWRRMLAAHFACVCVRVHAVAQETKSRWSSREDIPQAITLDLPQGSARKTYLQLKKTSLHPFTLDRRARLVLEIHELREWDKHQSHFFSQRQAERLAAALGLDDVVLQLRQTMVSDALELLSLQALTGEGRIPQLPDLPDIRWTASSGAELRQLMEKRALQRQLWLQRQREYLLQDLEWQ